EQLPDERDVGRPISGALDAEEHLAVAHAVGEVDVRALLRAEVGKRGDAHAAAVVHQKRVLHLEVEAAAGDVLAAGEEQADDQHPSHQRPFAISPRSTMQVELSFATIEPSASINSHS